MLKATDDGQDDGKVIVEAVEGGFTRFPILRVPGIQRAERHRFGGQSAD